MANNTAAADPFGAQSNNPQSSPPGAKPKPKPRSHSPSAPNGEPSSGPLSYSEMSDASVGLIKSAGKGNNSSGAASGSVDVKIDEFQPGQAFDVKVLADSISPYSAINLEGNTQQITISRSGISSRFVNYGKTMYNSCEIDTYKFIGVISNYGAQLMMYILLAYSVSSIMQFNSVYPQNDPDKILTPKNMIYSGCALYSAFRIINAFFVFLSSRYDANIKDVISAAWGSTSAHHQIVYKTALPKLIISDFDIPRFLEGIFGIGLIVGGNWMISTGLLSYGLALVTFGFVVVSEAVNGFVDSQRVITDQGYRFVNKTFNDTLGSNKNVDQNNLSGLREELNKLDTLIVKMNSKIGI